MTSSYPAVPETPPPAFRGMPELLAGACRGAGDCALVCPTRAITVEHRPDGWTWQLDRAACVACGLCVEACPYQALEVSLAFELAARSRVDLVRQDDFRGAAMATEARP